MARRRASAPSGGSASTDAGRFAWDRARHQDSIAGIARYQSGLRTMDTIDAATSALVAAGVSSPSSRPRLARMNENSPICASAMATVSAARSGYLSSRISTKATSGLATSTMASAPARSAGESSSDAGSSSMPTDTKNSTANASRSGSASEEARSQNADRTKTRPAGHGA